MGLKMSNGNRSHEMPGSLIFLMMLALVIAGTFLYNHLYRHENATRESVKRLSKVPMDDIESGSTIDADAWGRPMRFDRNGDKYAVQQTVTSAGEDGQFGTGDDIHHSDTDWNKSRIIGAWAGQKVKEAVKGAKDSPPSRFERYDEKRAEEEENPTAATKPSVLERLKDRLSKKGKADDATE